MISIHIPLDPMSSRKTTHIKVAVRYSKGGLEKPRGYSVSVCPVVCEDIFTTYLAYTGYNMVLQTVKRQTPKIEKLVDDEVEQALATKSGRVWDLIERVKQEAT
jgi:hypothetical protein